MAATNGGASSKVFDALHESSLALLEAIKAGNERGYRVSKKLIDEAERAQNEVLTLGRKFAQDPADLAGFSTAAFEKATEAQGRALELARQWFEELSGAGTETRDALQRVVNANREVGQALGEVTRGLATRGAEAFQSAFSGAIPTASTGARASSPRRANSPSDE